MNGFELATARQYGATPLVIVMDNGQYGTIRRTRRAPTRAGSAEPS